MFEEFLPAVDYAQRGASLGLMGDSWSEVVLNMKVRCTTTCND